MTPTQEDIIQAAREAGYTYIHSQWSEDEAEFMRKYFILAAEWATERACEACRPFGKTGAVVAAAIRGTSGVEGEVE